MDPIYDEISMLDTMRRSAQPSSRDSIRDMIDATEAVAEARRANPPREMDAVEREAAFEQARAEALVRPHHSVMYAVNHLGNRAEPSMAPCGCLSVNATPVTLPWLVPRADGLAPDTVAAVGIVHKTHTLERMLQMAPYLEGRCEAYGTTPAEVAMVLMALHNIHSGGSKKPHITTEMRNKALSVALAMYGATGAMDPQQAIDKARKQPWTRTIEFAQESSLTALTGLAITSSATAATYMAGVWAGAQIAKAKVATTGGGKLAAVAGAAAGTFATASLGIITGGAAVGSAIYFHSVIEAYRDVWDNEFSQDAYFFHKMRDHHILPDDDHSVSCYHLHNEWSSMTRQSLVGHRGIRWN